MFKDGDVIFGGLFDVDFLTVFPELSFRTEPEPPYCEQFDMESFQQAQTMAFAIDEINKNPNLLPNITLGYHVYDNCMMLGMAFRAAISLASGTEEYFSNLNCTGPPPVIGIVGDSSSTASIAISSILGLFRVPIVSHYATCSCLSDRKKYPSFFRTIPSDAFQVRAMVQILKYFGWTWVGLVYSDDDYGIYAAQFFQQEIQLFGGCIAFSEILPHDNNLRDIQHITTVIQASTARVVVVFSTPSFLIPLMDDVVLQNITGRQWIASEAWATSLVHHTPRLLPFLRGTLGIAIRRGEIQGLHEFLLRLHPSNDPKNNMLRIFWEKMFGCSYETDSKERDGEQVKKICTGQEDLRTTYTPYTDVSELRATYNVYKAVYALAHAFHDLMQCEEGRGPFSGNRCADKTNLKHWQLVHYLQKVNYTTGFGDHVSFDKNGDALAIYDVLNLQPSFDGSIRVKAVGVVNEGAATGMVLKLDEDALYWNFEPKKTPRSVCSESCPPGTRRATRKGFPICCFDCLPCGDGEISNTTDANECTVCPDEFWSNTDKDQCVSKEVEFLSYEEPLGISLTTVSWRQAVRIGRVLRILRPLPAHRQARERPSRRSSCGYSHRPRRASASSGLLFLPGERASPASKPAPFLPELHEEVAKSWNAPYSARVRQAVSLAFSAVDNAKNRGYLSLPPVEEAIAAHLCPPSAGRRAKLALPSKACGTGFPPEALQLCSRPCETVCTELTAPATVHCRHFAAPPGPKRETALPLIQPPPRHAWPAA
ncbi:unnamed protein product [Leuciscus chuanchicus]